MYLFLIFLDKQIIMVEKNFESMDFRDKIVTIDINNNTVYENEYYERLTGEQYHDYPVRLNLDKKSGKLCPRCNKQFIILCDNNNSGMSGGEISIQLICSSAVCGMYYSYVKTW